MSKLLIVDDELDVREFAKNFFTKRNIECFTASSGEEAIEIVKSQRPSLVLLDIKMNGLNGLDTLSQIRQIDNTIKVIMVTGVEEDSVANKAKQMGAFDYIHKPLVLAELEKVVLAELAKK